MYASWTSGLPGLSIYIYIQYVFVYLFNLHYFTQWKSHLESFRYIRILYIYVYKHVHTFFSLLYNYIQMYISSCFYFCTQIYFSLMYIYIYIYISHVYLYTIYIYIHIHILMVRQLKLTCRGMFHCTFLKQLAKACKARWWWRKNQRAQGAKNNRRQKTPVAQGRRDLVTYVRLGDINKSFTNWDAHPSGEHSFHPTWVFIFLSCQIDSNWLY